MASGHGGLASRASSTRRARTTRKGNSDHPRKYDSQKSVTAYCSAGVDQSPCRSGDAGQRCAHAEMAHQPPTPDRLQHGRHGRRRRCVRTPRASRCREAAPAGAGARRDGAATAPRTPGPTSTSRIDLPSGPVRVAASSGRCFDSPPRPAPHRRWARRRGREWQLPAPVPVRAGAANRDRTNGSPRRTGSPLSAQASAHMPQAGTLIAFRLSSAQTRSARLRASSKISSTSLCSNWALRPAKKRLGRSARKPWTRAIFASYARS
jgi:hypothetical protein